MGVMVPSMPIPIAYGTARIGGVVIWNNVDNFVGTNAFPGDPAERAPRYRSTCRQCGGPNQSGALACEWCRTPRT
jgi:hypothetical protein